MHVNFLFTYDSILNNFDYPESCNKVVRIKVRRNVGLITKDFINKLIFMELNVSLK